MALDDTYTVALLHFNGADTSTTFTDESGKTWTASGNAQIDTGITSPLSDGGGTAIFDGTGDYISAADSADWRLDGGSNSNAWTIDFWVRFNGDPGTASVGLISQYVDTANFWALNVGNNFLIFAVRVANVNTVVVSGAWDPATATWYHVAFVKDGTTGYTLYVNGTALAAAATDTDTMPDYASDLRIGKSTLSDGSDVFLNGWLDEFRISKGIARWTGNFTPPTGEY